MGGNEGKRKEGRKDKSEVEITEQNALLRWLTDFFLKLLIVE